MRDLYKNKYRIPSNRIRGWDYGGNGCYFITVVTAFRQELFGEIIENEMVLNDFGKILYDEFFKSFDIRKELYLGEFVIMPNHWHAIIILDRAYCYNLFNANVPSENQSDYFSTIRKSKSISSFVSSLKSSVITQIDNFIDIKHLRIDKFNKLNPLWQSNYYDHIIRTEEEYQMISNYIKTNPEKWGDDMFSKK